MNKNILITGSTDGIGKLAAIKLASEGHTIYLHGRNADKLNKTIAETKAASTNNNVFGFVSDFSDLKAVKKLAQKVKENVDHLDVLINNAGVFKSKIAHSKDGYDIRFAVNYLAPFLLTKELLPLLDKADGSRILNLSSAAQSEISYNEMLGKENTSVNESYAQSKLALTMWSFYLSDKLKNIAVIAVNPGSLLNTNMVKEAFGQSWAPADKGANILFELSLAEAHNLMSGKYFDNDSGTYAKAHPDAYNPEKIEKLIERSNTLITV